jgi:hypothetical protein
MKFKRKNGRGPLNSLPVLLSALGAASCAVAAEPTQERTLSRLLANPMEYDGVQLDLTIFPFDVGTDQSYIVCHDPCDAVEAGRSVTVLIPAVAGAYDGMTGTTSVRVQVEFDARCFAEPLDCSPHVGFIYRETAGMAADIEG